MSEPPPNTATRAPLSWLTPPRLAGIAWLLPPISGALVLLLTLARIPRPTENGPTHPLLTRFHAAQSICFGLLWLGYLALVTLGNSALAPVAVFNVIAPVLYLLLSGAGIVAGLLIWARALWCSLHGEMWELPVLGHCLRKKLSRAPD